MRKKITKRKSKLGIIAMCLTMAVVMGTTVGCGKNPFISGNEEEDATKTQIYVGTLNQGFGKAWLEEAAARFTELKKDESYESGKKGVQIFVDPLNIGNQIIGSVSNERSEIIFNESIDYYAWVQRGLVKDITKYVKSDLSEYGDEAGSTIESKLYSAAKDYYLYEGKYYGIPFYESTFGVIYDIDVFSDNNLFMDKNGEFALSSQSDPNASAGPDGDASTVIDNGLPATYSEFFALCDKIKKNSKLQPFTWNGQYPLYLSRMVQSMSMYLDGYTQSQSKFKLSGTINTIDSFDQSTPVVTEKIITKDNGYETFASEGMYYALEFLQGLYDGKYYVEEYLNSNAYSHLSAQNDFVTNNTKTTSNSIKRDVAMLVDGTWFMNEAAGTLTALAKRDPEAGANERRFGLMPLPHPDGWESKKYTYLDTNFASCFVTAQTADWKMDLIGEFLKFLHSDAELRKFTESTSTLRGFDYVTDWDTSSANLTPYAQQLISLRKYIGDEVVYPISSNQLYANNITVLCTELTDFFSATIGNNTYNNPFTAMSGGSKISARSYFNGMKNYHNASWWKKTFGSYLSGMGV